MQQLAACGCSSLPPQLPEVTEDLLKLLMHGCREHTSRHCSPCVAGRRGGHRPAKASQTPTSVQAMRSAPERKDPAPPPDGLRDNMEDIAHVFRDQTTIGEDPGDALREHAVSFCGLAWASAASLSVYATRPESLPCLVWAANIADIGLWRAGERSSMPRRSGGRDSARGCGSWCACQREA